MGAPVADKIYEEFRDMKKLSIVLSEVSAHHLDKIMQFIQELMEMAVPRFNYNS